MKKITKTICKVALCGAFTVTSHAATIAGGSGITSITGPAGVSYSVFAGGAADASQLIDGEVGGDTSNVTWAQPSVDGAALPHTYTLFLDQAYDITNTHVWNDFGLLSNGVNGVTVGFKNGAATVGTQTIAVAGQFDDDISVPQDFSTTFNNVTSVEFTVNSVHGLIGPENGGQTNTYQFGEIQFEGTVAVPEPSSIALLGLGGLALILRRRK